MAQEVHVCEGVLLDTACRIGDDLNTVDHELHDPARRRGLWFRSDKTASGVVVSLFAGREAGDSYVTLRECVPLLPFTMRQLLDVLSDARFAFVEGHASVGDWSAVDSQFAPHHGGYCAETAERCEATP
jgi:hypothetical protein